MVVAVIPAQRFTAERAARAHMADLRTPRSTLEAERVANASMVMPYDRARIVRRAGPSRARPSSASTPRLHLGLEAP
jgi:hypothetical protein